MTDKKLHQNLKVGFTHPGFIMNSAKQVFEIEDIVRDEMATFNVSFGPLKMGENVFKETYVLEISYKKAEEKQRDALGIRTFGSHLHSYFGEKAHEIAERVISDYGFTLNQHLNSWPVYRAIVSTNGKEPIDESLNDDVNNIPYKLF